MRYEDFARTLMQNVQRLFMFLGLHLTKATLDFVESHTSGEERASGAKSKGAFSTYRNSSTTPFEWRFEMSMKKIDSIQSLSSCSKAMKLWGYYPMPKSASDSEAKLEMFNPLVDGFSLSKHFGKSAISYEDH
jgi:hypothetical protein